MKGKCEKALCAQNTKMPNGEMKEKRGEIQTINKTKGKQNKRMER